MGLVWLDSSVKKQTLYASSNTSSQSNFYGILVIDTDGSIVQIDENAQSVIGVRKDHVLNQKYDEVICKPLKLENKFKFENLSAISMDHKYKVNIFRNGNSCKEIQFSILPSLVSASEEFGYIIMVYDSEAFERELEDKIRDERLSAMRQISESITHEIRNPLGCIELFASALKGPINQEGFDEPSETVTKCIRTINSILSNINLFFETELKPSFSEVDINVHLNESLFFSKYLFSENEDISILKNLSEEQLIIYGDNELLKQMSMNIILNAFQAIKDSGSIEICTRKIVDTLNGKECVEISYADTGLGIEESNLNKVFDPYFTTKNMGQGLGLSIVNNIVKLHDGSIQIKKRKLKGTKINILMPLVSNKYIQKVA